MAQSKRERQIQKRNAAKKRAARQAAALRQELTDTMRREGFAIQCGVMYEGYNVERGTPLTAEDKGRLSEALALITDCREKHPAPDPDGAQVYEYLTAHGVGNDLASALSGIASAIESTSR